MSIISVVSLVAGKMSELLVQEAKLLYGVEDQVRSLQGELMMMDSFLEDMEARDEGRGDQRSRTTIDQIRKIVYDAEDIIESYILEANKAKDLVKHVVGLEEDMNKFVGMLATDDTNIQVLSILGMGGSGKTTLARKFYNHGSVKKHFDCIAWLSISREWVAQQIMIELLRKVGEETVRVRKDEDWTLQVLVEKLHRFLEGKRYLIVLDDVWTKQALEEIFPALPNDGRRILITTRKREVTDFPDLKCSIHEPRRLTKEESWDLFRKIALIHREKHHNFIDVSVLETLGKEMLNKCGGLPLAVIALAGILANKETVEDWEMVKKAVSSRIMEEGRGTHLYGPVNEMLTLSYNDLHRDLKPCFLYLAMFPEDRNIPTGELIRMWIVEGFISSDMLKEGETLEDVARDYLEELIDRFYVRLEDNVTYL